MVRIDVVLEKEERGRKKSRKEREGTRVILCIGLSQHSICVFDCDQSRSDQSSAEQ